MKTSKELRKLGKLMARIGLIYMALIWIEFILMFFNKFKTLGVIIYREFGVDFLSIYLAHFFIVGFFFLSCNKKISEIDGVFKNEIDSMQVND